MKKLIPILFILFSCSKEKIESVEETKSARGGIPGKPVKAIIVNPGQSIQAAINSGLNVTVKAGLYKENLSYRNVSSVNYEDGAIKIGRDSVFGNVNITGLAVFINDSTRGKTLYISSTATGVFNAKRIVDSSYIEEAVVNYGHVSLNADIVGNGGGIVTQDGRLDWKGNVQANNDYGIRVSGGEFYGNGSSYSKLNSALHCAGGYCYFEFTGTLKSDGLFAFEMSGGDGKLFKVYLITTNPDPVEGNGISKYGGRLLKLDDITINSSGQYSIEKQGVIDRGSIEFLSTCYANKPIEPGMNIINPEKLITP